jgi:hypothetical protein
MRGTKSELARPTDAANDEGARRSIVEQPFAAEAPMLPIPESSEPEVRDPGVSDSEIRLRAYEIYLARGGSDGDPVADWLAAERQLRASHALGGSASAPSIES